MLSLLLQPLLKVEVELKYILSYILSYMPIGVLTYPQLRRELRRCVELGEPWPFVLAVIPPSTTRRKSSTSLVPFTLRGILGWSNFAAPSRLLIDHAAFDWPVPGSVDTHSS